MRFLHREIKGLSGNMACLKARRQICRLFLYKRQVRDYRLACKKYSLKEKEQLRNILKRLYKDIDFHVDGSMVYFCCTK